MNVQISNCYYHNERLAVATCAQCGAGICRGCAVKDDSGKVICFECGNSNIKQEHKEYRKMLKQQGGRFISGKEFILPGIIGVLIIVAVCLLDHFLNRYYSADGFFGGINDYGIIGIIFVAYMLFSIPFCMIMLNDIFAPRYDTINNRFNKWYFKVVISMCVGWLVLIV